MKRMTKAILLAAVSTVALSSGAWAQSTDQVSSGLNAPSYGAVDSTNTPIPTGDPRINADGTFTAACTGCSWVAGTPAVGQASYSTFSVKASNGVTGNSGELSADSLVFKNTSGAQTSLGSAGLVTNGVVGATNGVTSAGIGGAGLATFGTPNGTGPATFSVNAATGNVNSVGTITGQTISDGAGSTISGGTVTAVTVNAATLTDGAGTTVSGGTVTTNNVKATTVKASSVTATMLSTQDSGGFVYSNVGDTLTSQQTQITANTAGISHLTSLYNTQQGEINAVDAKASKALAAAAIDAALPQLHFSNGDWVSIAAGGGEVGGQAAWGLALGVLPRPNILIAVKGGSSGSTNVIAGSASISFGGGYQPLK